MQKPVHSSTPTDERERMTRLHTRFYGSLVRFFSRRASTRNDVDDMVQDVFERLIRRGTLRDADHVDGYVFTTASNVLMDRLRRGRVRQEDQQQEFDPDAHSAVDFSPEHVLVNREQLAKASAILLELPERTRAIFVMRRLEGMKYRDIAVRFGISVSAVEKQMERAMAHIERRMGDE